MHSEAQALHTKLRHEHIKLEKTTRTHGNRMREESYSRTNLWCDMFMMLNMALLYGINTI